MKRLLLDTIARHVVRLKLRDTNIYSNAPSVHMYNSYNELKVHTTLHIKIDKLRQSIKTSDDLACVSLELYS